MRLRLSCATHKCEVVSAEGSNLHWIPIPVEGTAVDELGSYSEWELDAANLYCTSFSNDDKAHQFVYTISLGEH